eukprot:GHVR01104619.1.p1 GENE.GHVR01104619.1~~GHVR01104619.1.p1  ORF type:complete len:187 (+),score=24.06 GHVR01104619.1:66-626(+)
MKTPPVVGQDYEANACICSKAAENMDKAEKSSDSEPDMVDNSEIPSVRTTMIAVVTRSGWRTSEDEWVRGLHAELGSGETEVRLPGPEEQPGKKDPLEEQGRLRCVQPEQLVPDIPFEDGGEADITNLEDLASDGKIYLGSEHDSWNGPTGPLAEREKFFSPRGGRIEEDHNIPSSDTNESFSSDE